jgi:hypothetical protein
VPLTLDDQHVPFDAWFDDVQVRESKAIQLLCDARTGVTLSSLRTMGAT